MGVEHGLHEIRDGVWRVSFVIAMEVSDDVGSLRGDLVEVGEVAFGAEHHEWTLVTMLKPVERVVDGAEHELGGLGVLVLVEREVAVRSVGLDRRLHLEREPEVESLGRVSLR